MAHNLEEGTVIAQYFNVIIARKTHSNSNQLSKSSEVAKDKPSDINQIDYSNKTSAPSSDNVPKSKESVSATNTVGSNIDVTF